MTKKSCIMMLAIMAMFSAGESKARWWWEEEPKPSPPPNPWWESIVPPAGSPLPQPPLFGMPSAEEWAKCFDARQLNDTKCSAEFQSNVHGGKLGLDAVGSDCCDDLVSILENCPVYSFLEHFFPVLTHGIDEVKKHCS